MANTGVNFCLGFAQGAVLIKMQSQLTPRSVKLFCMPTPPALTDRSHSRIRRLGTPIRGPDEKETAMNKTVLTAVVARSVASCSDMSPTRQRALTGTVGGAGIGAVAGAIGGYAGLGAAVVAGAGLLCGLVFDQHRRAEDRTFQQGVAAGKQRAGSGRRDYRSGRRRVTPDTPRCGRRPRQRDRHRRPNGRGCDAGRIYAGRSLAPAARPT